MNDQSLEADLGARLHALVAEVDTPPGLADGVMATHSRRRRRSGGVLGGVAVLAAAAVAVVIAFSGGASAPELRLAAFRLRLPARSHLAPIGSHTCLPAMVLYPSTKIPSGGPPNPTEPQIASGVNSAGGCVHILLTAPFVPGGNEAPKPFMDDQKARSVTVGAYRGTLGPATWTGGNINYDGYRVSSGTVQSVLSLQVPAGRGEVEELVFSAEKVSLAQLLSIVRSGLSTAPATH